MKNLAVLGSTGSIGRNALKIVEMFPDRFKVKALTGAVNVDLLARQIELFKPDMAVVIDEEHAEKLKRFLRPNISVDILYGEDGYRLAASYDPVHQVVAAMVGAAGLKPTLAAISAGKDVALANKETLVMAGDMVMQEAKKSGSRILPVDSEHSAIFQSMAGSRRLDVRKIFLTASGGPFLNTDPSCFAAIKPQDALKHPNWQMGKKITIDSATLMNKGFEVIEAKFLFNISEDFIEVLIHPQSIIHSMVGYADGSVIAQLGMPDMRSAIAYALSWPERLNVRQPLPDFVDISTLTFQKPDLEKFLCLSLAQKACKTGKTMPAVLNAANEIAVQAFLEERIAFAAIPKIIRDTMNSHTVIAAPMLDDILHADQWARNKAREVMGDG